MISPLPRTSRPGSDRRFVPARPISLPIWIALDTLPHLNLTRGFAQLAVVRIFRWSISRKLARGMAPNHFLLPLLLPGFQQVRLVFSASLAAGCGFVMVDSDQGSGAATPGRCRRCSVQDWPGARRRSAPTLPQRGLCGCAASPAPVFSAPALGTRSRVLLLDWGCSLVRKLSRCTLF